MQDIIREILRKCDTVYIGMYGRDSNKPERSFVMGTYGKDGNK